VYTIDLPLSSLHTIPIMTFFSTIRFLLSTLVLMHCLSTPLFAGMVIVPKLSTHGNQLSFIAAENQPNDVWTNNRHWWIAYSTKSIGSLWDNTDCDARLPQIFDQNSLGIGYSQASNFAVVSQVYIYGDWSYTKASLRQAYPVLNYFTFTLGKEYLSSLYTLNFNLHLSKAIQQSNQRDPSIIMPFDNNDLYYYERVSLMHILEKWHWGLDGQIAFNSIQWRSIPIGTVLPSIGFYYKRMKLIIPPSNEWFRHNQFIDYDFSSTKNVLGVSGAVDVALPYGFVMNLKVMADNLHFLQGQVSLHIKVPMTQSNTQQSAIVPRYALPTYHVGPSIPYFPRISLQEWEPTGWVSHHKAAWPPLEKAKELQKWILRLSNANQYSALSLSPETIQAYWTQVRQLQYAPTVSISNASIFENYNQTTTIMQVASLEDTAFQKHIKWFTNLEPLAYHETFPTLSVLIGHNFNQAFYDYLVILLKPLQSLSIQERQLYFQKIAQITDTQQIISQNNNIIDDAINTDPQIPALQKHRVITKLAEIIFPVAPYPLSYSQDVYHNFIKIITNHNQDDPIRQTHLDLVKALGPSIVGPESSLLSLKLSKIKNAFSGNTMLDYYRLSNAAYIAYPLQGTLTAFHKIMEQKELPTELQLLILEEILFSNTQMNNLAQSFRSKKEIQRISLSIFSSLRCTHS